MATPLSPSLLKELAAIDTCAVADAIDCLDVRLRNEGYSNLDQLHCHFPHFPPMVGYAVTLRVRSGNPPMQGGTYAERTDWWRELDALPSPHVLVVEDVDKHPGRGSFVGDVHAALLQAMGCVGVVTNGAVRALPAIEKLGLNLFSHTVSPSHGYIHVVDYAKRVEVAGLHVTPGDLLHGDRHGIIRIPHDIAARIPETVASVKEREREIIAYCQTKGFSREKLHQLLHESRC